MILSQANLNLIKKADVIVPQPNVFELPEKVLQFGTGVLLRGLPDYFIDKANKQGIFNGRVAVVKSTSGPTSEFDAQDNLYTLCIRGISNGEFVSENIISSAISRVISAHEDWNAILEIAKSKDLEIIVSNTTEVGIQLVQESIHQNPPVSFPAKVLAVLHERYQTLGSSSTGLVIIATELIPENGKKLEAIVLELAHYNKLSADFISWLQSENRFCNSLVDRIVPGKPDAVNLAKLQNELGYEDHFLSMSEPYSLWAIEGDVKVAEVLSFAKVDEGVVIAEDIEIYRELKVRLLNGTHTLTSGIAYLSGINLVKDAMQNEEIKTYIDSVMATEIAPAIPYKVTEVETTKFAGTVKDRFANPSIEHLWLNITFQYSMKMKIRILPLLLNHYQLFNNVPENIAFGFAAYLAFMNVTDEKDGKFYGSYNGKEYLITDDSASYFNKVAKENYPSAVLKDADFWTTDLALLPGFLETVIEKYNLIAENGIEAALKAQNSTQLI